MGIHDEDQGGCTTREEVLGIKRHEGWMGFPNFESDLVSTTRKTEWIISIFKQVLQNEQPWAANSSPIVIILRVIIVSSPPQRCHHDVLHFRPRIFRHFCWNSSPV